MFFFFFSSRRRHTRCGRDWSSDVCSSDLFAELAEVGMHSIQTSGNVVRNTTTDEYAGVLAEEVTDPRPYAEIIRRSEERRVGKECRSRGWTDDEKKKVA